MLCEQVNTLQAQANDFNKYLVTIEARTDAYEGMILKAEKDIEQLQTQNAKLNSRVTQSEATINELQLQVANDNKHITYLDERDVEKDRQIEGLLKLVEELIARVDELENR